MVCFDMFQVSFIKQWFLDTFQVTVSAHLRNALLQLAQPDLQLDLWNTKSVIYTVLRDLGAARCALADAILKSQ